STGHPALAARPSGIEPGPTCGRRWWQAEEQAVLTSPAHLQVERTSLRRFGRELMPLAYLAEALRGGASGGLVTISNVDGGTPKPLGTYMAVLSDGVHAGHISGGCVEPAIAAEVAPLLAEGRDQIIRFGKDSCLMDIRFPCGGGVDLLVHASPRLDLLDEALSLAKQRKPFSIAFDLERSRAHIAEAGAATHWQDGVFWRRHLPRPRLVMIGRGPDFEVMARVAAAAEFELMLMTPDADSVAVLSNLDVPIERLESSARIPDVAIDPWTAVVLVFHEREWEAPVLTTAASSSAFYVGALGSRRTHEHRRAQLALLGMPTSNIERIRGPIGLVDRARDPGTLALSVLAEIAAEWAAVERA
ncbi:MAG: XdhC family protein, partial [Planctomycetales bacterium]|nr:XdhC family protein [Planctomycetales bacterium]